MRTITAEQYRTRTGEECEKGFDRAWCTDAFGQRLEVEDVHVDRVFGMVILCTSQGRMPVYPDQQIEIQ